MNSRSLARGLAFFSVGLGVTQLVAPRSVSRLIGLEEDHATLMRLLRRREMGAAAEETARSGYAAATLVRAREEPAGRQFEPGD